MTSLRPALVGIAIAALVYGGVMVLGGRMVNTSTANLAVDLAVPKTLPSTAKTTAKKYGSDLAVTLAPPVTAKTTAKPQVTPWPSVAVVIRTPAPTLAVVINEIAWMGTATSSNDEWMELYNSGAASVDVSGWHLASDDGKPTIVLMGSIAAHGYYLIERTDDRTVSDVPASLVASFGSGLSNTGENLKLTDFTGATIDEVDAKSGWYAGDNTSKATMERISAMAAGNIPSNWASNTGAVVSGSDAAGRPLRGTPGYRNSVTP